MKKLVLHLDSPNEKDFIRAMATVENFVKEAAQEGCFAVLLVNGPAVNYFAASSSHAETLRELVSKTNVRIELCNHALAKAGMTQSDLAKDCVTVKSGVYELVRLQAEDYAYVKV